LASKKPLPNDVLENIIGQGFTSFEVNLTSSTLALRITILSGAGEHLIENNRRICCNSPRVLLLKLSGIILQFDNGIFFKNKSSSIQ